MVGIRSNGPVTSVAYCQFTGMDCLKVISLVVLTLLQLCRAEIKDVQPQWYAANVINDGFQPKSISELFSSDAPFSTANPIIVSSVDNNDDIRMISSSQPPTSLSSTGFTQTSTFPPSIQSTLSSMSTQSPITQFSSTQAPVRQSKRTTQSVAVQPINRKTTLEPQRNVQIQQDQTASTQTYTPIMRYPTTAMEGNPQDVRMELVPQSTGPDGLPQNIPLSNYFLIYQQAPVQNYQNPGTTLGEFTTAAPPLQSTFAPTFSSPSPTFSTTPATFTTPFTTTLAPVTQNLQTSTVPKVTVTSLSSIGTTRNLGSTSNTGSNVQCTFPSTTPLPNQKPINVPINSMFPLKISVRGPSGSITNVNFNPVVKAQPTPKTTTTRKPTTKRTPKPKKNTYERCLQGCRKNGQNLCAAPLSQYPVDPKSLRGFPSVCHMACHNSYRKDPFEKVADGSCSKLRTRIRPLDSNTKLKRDELHKVQYFLDDSGPKAIVEVSGTYS